MSRMTKKSALLRGAVAVRADTPSDPLVAIAAVNAAFEAFQSNQAQRDTDRDVLLEEQETRIQASIDEAMAAIQAQNEQISQMELGGSTDDPEVSAQERAYTAAFDTFFRRGREEDIQASIAAGDVRAALSVGSDEDGGYTTPVEWDRTITDALRQVSGMRNYAQVMEVSGRGFTRLFNVGGLASGWVGETDARPETSSPTLKPYTYGFGEIYANPAATQRILDDSEINIEEWLAGEVALKFAQEEGTAFVNGDGVDKPKGLLGYTATAEAALAANLQHPLGGIEEIASGAAANITTDGLLDLVYALPTERNDNAAFYMNRTSQGVCRKLKDGDGNYIWQPPFQQGEPATLLGHAQRELLGMPDIAADAFPIGFGDMARTYSIFDRMQVRVLRDPFTNKPYVHFYTTKRVGGGLWNPEFFKFQKVSV